MRLRVTGALLVAGALVMPTAGLARSVKPADGKYTGTANYKVAGTPQSGSLTINVANRKITGATFTASVPPINPRLSKGPACGAANSYPTTGYKRAGTTSSSGQFDYVFTHKTKTFSDKITLVGRFTSSTQAVGVWRDVSDSKASRSHCDTGKVKFTVNHS